MGQDRLDVLDLEGQLQRAASLMARPSLHPWQAPWPRASMLRGPVARREAGPPFPGELLAELLPLVGEINAVLDPDELLPAIARQAAADRRLPDPRHLPARARRHPGARLRGGLRPRAGRRRLRLRPGRGDRGGRGRARASRSSSPTCPRTRATSRSSRASWPSSRSRSSTSDRLVGVLNIEGPDAEAFTPDARTALQVLAGHLAVAIENATLYRETRWYAGLLATLYEIGKETASILDLDELLAPRGRDREARDRLRDVRHPPARRGAAGAGAAQGRAASAASSEKRRIKVGEGLCGAAVLQQGAGPGGRRAEGPALPEPRPRDALRARGAARPQGPRGRRLRPRVAGARPLHRGAREGADARSRARWRWRSRTRASTTRSAQGTKRVQKELAIAQEIQHGLFPEECPTGPGWEASAHFRPARELGGDLYDFYDIGEGAPGRSPSATWPARACRRRSTAAFASGTVRARAFERRAPADLMQRVNRTLRRRGVEGLFCTLAYALFDFRAAHAAPRELGPALPASTTGAATRACEPLEVGGPSPRGLRRGRPTTSSRSTSRRATSSSSTPTASARPATAARSTGRGGSSGARGPRGAPAPELGDEILADLEGFLGDEAPPTTSPSSWSRCYESDDFRASLRGREPDHQPSPAAAAILLISSARARALAEEDRWLSWRWPPSRPPPPGRCSPSRRGATSWCSPPPRWTARAGR